MKSDKKPTPKPQGDSWQSIGSAANAVIGKLLSGSGK